jgi:5-methylthioadenosine/S-adenosylhomocysteine deaminase
MLLERRGAAIVASPTAEMKLADGVAPVADYVRRGMTVALGTDGAVCNNGHDMFIECRQLALLQKLDAGAAAMPAEGVLRIATHGGACALGDGGRYGVLAPGACADLILVDTANPRLQPLMTAAGERNAARNLVFAATGQDVTDVMVGGRWLVRDRCLLTADAPALWRDLAQAAEEIHRRIALE